MPIPLPLAVAAAATAALALAALLSALTTIRARRSALAFLPCAPGGVSWLVGHTPDMLAPDFHLRLSAWADALGPTFTINGICGSRAVVISDPVSLAIALGARGTSSTVTPSPPTRALPGNPLPAAAPFATPFPKWRPAYGVMDGVWGGKVPSIFTVADLTPTWRAVRRATAPCFSAAAIRAHFPLITSRLAALGDTLVGQARLCRPGKAFEVAMDGACMRLAVDVIGMVREERERMREGWRWGAHHPSPSSSPLFPSGRLWQGLRRRLRRPLPHGGVPDPSPGGRAGKHD